MSPEKLMPPSDEYRKEMAEQYRQMHAKGAFAGTTYGKHLMRFEYFLGEDEAKILDFGCGPRGGLASEKRLNGVVPYDPYIEQFSEEPWDKDLDTFFSSDVFEHLSIPEVSETLTHLHDPKWHRAFIAVSTRAASKSLPNGMNAHALIWRADTWFGVLCDELPMFGCVIAESDLLLQDAVFAFVRKKS